MQSGVSCRNLPHLDVAVRYFVWRTAVERRRGHEVVHTLLVPRVLPAVVVAREPHHHVAAGVHGVQKLLGIPHDALRLVRRVHRLMAKHHHPWV